MTTEFGQYYAIASEGARIGLIPCNECGATIIVGGENFDKAHVRWHGEMDDLRREVYGGGEDADAVDEERQA